MMINMIPTPRALPRCGALAGEVAPALGSPKKRAPPLVVIIFF